MNIEFVKWLIGYAEGYHLKFKGILGKGSIDYVDYGEDIITLDEFISCESMAMSLLLQRAIEGVNRKIKSNFWFHQDEDITAWIYGKEPKIFRNENIDQAKEQALKYIYEQEAK